MLNNYLKIFSNQSQIKIFILITILSILSVFFELLSLSSLIPLLSLLIDPKLFLDKSRILLNDDIILKLEYFINTDFALFLIIISSFIVFSFIIKNLFLAIVQFLKFKFFKDLQTNLSIKYYSNYLNTDYNFYIKRNTSDIVRNIDREIPNFIAYLNTIILIIQDLAIIIATSIILSLINIKIFLIIFFMLIIFSFSYFKYFKKKIIYAGRVRQKNQKKFVQSIFESFALKNYILIESLLPFFQKKFSNFSTFLFDSQFKKNVILMLTRYLLEIFLILIIISILLFLYKDSNNLKATQFSMGIIFICIFRLSPPFNRIMNAINSLKFIKISVNLLSRENKNFKKISNKKKIFTKKETFNFLKLENISFAYEEKNSGNIFSNLNLKINRGDKICIIGQTGSGKSTFINMIMGILEPTKGRINLNNSVKKKLYEKVEVSYVPQKIFLLDSTIKNNILLGSNYDEKHLNNVLEISNLSNFILKLKKSVNTIVGEDAKKISIGQKQRIGIARAIYKQFDLLILDEATSSLDEKTEKAVIKRLITKFKDKTILCITHRLSNVKLFDTTLEIKNGEIKKK